MNIQSKIVTSANGLLVRKRFVPFQWISKFNLIVGEKVNAELWKVISTSLSNKEDIRYEIDGTMFYLRVQSLNNLCHSSFDLQSKKSYSSRSKSINRYQMLVEAANDIIYETDIYGCFTYANPKAIGIVGYPFERVIGMSYLELIRDDHKEKVAAFYREQMAESRLISHCKRQLVM